MATNQRNKPTSNAAAADMSSPESLSFAGLVQDQQPKTLPPPKKAKQFKASSKQSPEFEFVSITANAISAADSTKSTPADMLISNGILEPQALITSPPIPLASFLETHGKLNRQLDSRKKHELRATDKANKQRTSWFGEKMFMSIMSSCQKCKVIQPGHVKAQTIAGECERIY